MILVDGRALSAQITEEIIAMVKEKAITPTLVVVTCDPNFETKKFLALKQKKAETLGVMMNTIFLPKESSTEEIITLICNESKKVDGVIVQLPLPKHIDTDAVLNSIPKTKDVDRFDYKGEDTDILPPVVGAIDEIAKFHSVNWYKKKVVVFGQGRLVGSPALLYASTKGASVSVITEKDTNVSALTKSADIIILGVGKSNLLTKDMVKEGVIVFDAGASEDGGLLVGDASPDLASKASLLTPVPGGIGPMTVVLLFRNLLKLCSRQ
jgi:methylenetetrahydrofolate dehydrogenase (NADP+)/methenyltetrahydrofolate cyclohydrolase